MKRKYAATICATLILAPFSALAEPIALTAESYDTLLVGNTVLFTTSNGNRMKVFYKPDLKATINGENGFVDSGEYTFEDGKVCSAWSRIRNGKKTCFSTVIDGDKVITTYADGSTLTGTLKKGAYNGYE